MDKQPKTETPNNLENHRGSSSVVAEQPPVHDVHAVQRDDVHAVHRDAVHDDNDNADADADANAVSGCGCLSDINGDNGCDCGCGSKLSVSIADQYAQYAKPSILSKMYGIVPMVLFIGVTVLFLFTLTSCASLSQRGSLAYNTLNLTQFSPVYVNAPVSSFESEEFNAEQYRALIEVFKAQGYNVVDSRTDATYEIYVNIVNIFTAKQFSSSIQRGLSLETFKETPNKRTPPRKAYKAESIQPTNYTYVYMQSYVPISSTFQDRKVLVWEGSANVRQDEYLRNYRKTLQELVGEYGDELRRSSKTQLR